MGNSSVFDEVDWEDIRQPANPLPLLQKWYQAHCDNNWEHQQGIKIETIDNPGWRVTIDLKGTPLDGKAFDRTEMNMEDESSNRWMVCWVENGQWNSAGDEKRLNRMLLEFLHWAARVDPGWPTRKLL